MSFFEIVWEYQSLASKWVEFDKNLTSFLNSLPSDTTAGDREIEGWKMQFDLQQMRLRNMDTGFTRSIRCALRSAGEEEGLKHVWSYQGEPRKRWTSFPPELAVKLEQHFGQIGDSNEKAADEESKVEFALNGKEVQVDWGRKMMTVLETEEERSVKRSESNAGPPDSSNPPHPTSSPTATRERNSRFNEEQASKKKNKGRKSLTTRKRTDGKDEENEQPKKKPKRGRPKKGKKVDEQSASEEEQVEIQDDEDDGRSSHTEAEDEPENGNEENTTATEQSEAPEVDFECGELAKRAHVYVDEKGYFYDVMLNQTNIQQNNNKFYLMQLLTSGTDYWVWFRWGRVGLRGQSNLTPFGSDLEGAINMFHNKFLDKTRNDFLESKNSFVKVSGKYDLIKLDYARKITIEEKKSDECFDGENGGNSQLDERVRALMNIICDLKAMENDARKLDYDYKRIPLGKITKMQIHAGYEALSRIEKHIHEGKFGRDFTEAVNEYYTRIPHSFGMRTPPMIKTMEELKREIELLELLTGIEITVAKIAGDPLEQHYARLQWKLVPLDREDEKFKIVADYLLNTHGPTHDKYRLELRNVFELHQKGDNKKFRSELDNVKLLWHGSRLANWYSILAQGLRIAPPEVPSTGFMFGKGVYFADVSSKAANYSLSDADRPGFLLLSEVALGQVLDMFEADDQIHRKLPEGKHSVRGVGRLIPSPDVKKVIDRNVEIPCGKPTQNAELISPDDTSLIYNEFIVYSLDQIRERFLVEVAFKFEFEL